MPLQRSNSSCGMSVIQSRIVNARRDEVSVPISEALGSSPVRVCARADHMDASAPWMLCNHLASMMRISALLANHFGAAGLLRQVRVTGWPLSPRRVSVT